MCAAFLTHAKLLWQRTLSQGSVDIYAAQCKNCLKWREIDTQEEFEEIRSKVAEEPFLCSRKANSSCDEPGDIKYDSSRTWVIDKPNLPKTPQGFKRSLVLRKDYSKLDAYYITPAGKKLRTRNEIAAFLKVNPEFKGVSASDFDFSSPKIMQDTIPEVVEQKDSANKKVKIAKDEVWEISSLVCMLWKIVILVGFLDVTSETVFAVKPNMAANMAASKQILFSCFCIIFKYVITMFKCNRNSRT